MDNFDNVTIVKKANIYYEGKVSSRTIIFPDGNMKTLGFMLAGDYKFSTKEKEIMEILGGEADVLLPTKNQWENLTQGSQFEVPAGSEFELRVKLPLDYCCSYVSE